MPSLLARFRSRTVSQPAPPSLSPLSPTADTNFTTPPPILPVITNSPLQRKIHPEVNSLLEEFSAQRSPPPVRRARSASHLRHSHDEPPLSPLSPPPPINSPPSLHEDERHARLSSESSNGGGRKRFLQRISSLATAGEWSTFGRLRDMRHADLNEVRGRVWGKDKSGSLRSSATRTRSSRPSTGHTGSTRSSQKYADTNKENTSGFPPLSLPPLPHFGRPRANTSPTERTSTRISTPVAEQLGFDSPRTFGYPTPATAAGSSPAYTQRHDASEVPGVYADYFAVDARGSTFPMRSGNMPASDFNLSPEFTFGHGIRAYRSLPRVEQIFSNSARQNQAERPNDGLRSRSTSAIRHGRRASADLFAQQAVNIAAGVSAASDWPARVSRELVLMSLGGDNANPSSAPRGLDSLALQESNVSSTTQESVGRLSSSSPSHPVIPPLSPSVFASLGSPSDLAPASSPSLAAVSRSISYELLKAGDSHPNVNLPMTPQSQDINAPVASSSRISEPTAASALLPSFSIPAPPPNSFASPHFSSPTTSVESHGSSLSPPQYVKGKGKGRADEADATVLDHNQGQRASFSLPEPRSPRRLSGVIRTPSSGRRRRAIFSSPLPAIQSRPNSMALSQSFPVAETDHMGDLGPAPRPSSTATDGDAPPRRSVSQSSIPISALIKAHAPSVGRSSMYHMRDPHKPPRKLETGWALRFRAEDEEGSPRHAWLFYVAFVLFPLWWVASFLPTPKTRRVGTDAEKAVTLDDPQVEFDATSWRKRCRIMAVVSLFTYIPFIILLAVFLD